MTDVPAFKNYWLGMCTAVHLISMNAVVHILLFSAVWYSVVKWEFVLNQFSWMNKGSLELMWYSEHFTSEFRNWQNPTDRPPGRSCRRCNVHQTAGEAEGWCCGPPTPTASSNTCSWFLFLKAKPAEWAKHSVSSCGALLMRMRKPPMTKWFPVGWELYLDFILIST